MRAKDFRIRAWQSLSGNWGIAILAYLLVGAVNSAASSLGGVVAWLIVGIVGVGQASFTLSLARRERASLEQLLDGTKELGNSFVAGLLVCLYTFLWTLLLIVPGIIKALSYSMTYYILRDNPGMPASVAMERSENMMIGHKWQLFCLYCSFIGWYLLSILTCGILLILVAPYLSQVNAEFYRYLNGEIDFYQETTYDQNSEQI